MGQAADIFVSYKAEDRARVQPLVAALEAEGFSVWWDTHIGGGAHWREEIQEHLDAAKCVVVVWTKRAIGHDGNFVRDEASRAQRRRVYVPIRLDPVEPPLGFGEVQAISLSRWHGDRSDPRFLALADAVRECLTGEHAPRVQSYPAQLQISRRTVISGGAVAAAAVAGIGVWELLKPSATSASTSIAVLPFANLSGDPSQSYFSDGIADEIRSALARLGGLTVIGSTSSEAVRNDDARMAATKLGAANILAGNVRQSSSTIRISAELIDGRTGADRWTQDYDRPPGDVLAIQTNIAENVAEALSIRLIGATKAALRLGGTAVPAALDLFLQADPGRSNGSPEGILHSIAKLDAAIQLDPNFAQAHARKASALSTYGGTYVHSLAEKASYLDQAAAAAKRAIALAPKLPEGHTALSFVYRNELRLKDSNREIGIAVSLPGAAATTWSSYGVFLAQNGRAGDVLDAESRATQLDPLNAGVFTNKAWTLFALHQYSSAVAAARQALRLEPTIAAARRFLVYSLIMMHRYDEATDELSKLPMDNVQAEAARAIIASATGNLEASNKLITQMQQASGDTANYQYAQVYAQRNDADAAIAFLDRALEARDPGLASVRADPFLDPIRGDPRFGEIVRKLEFSA